MEDYYFQRSAYREMGHQTFPGEFPVQPYPMAKPKTKTPVVVEEAPAALPEPIVTRSRKEQVRRGIMKAKDAMSYLLEEARAFGRVGEALLRETPTWKWLERRA